MHTSRNVCCNGHKAQQQQKFKPVTHIIFDMDGTLINSEVVYLQVFEKLLAAVGKKLTPEVIYKIKGSTKQRVYDVLINTYNLPYTEDELHSKVMEETHNALENVELMPGAKKLMCHFSCHKIPIALATSSGADMVELKTHKNHSQLFKLLHHKVMAGTDKEVKHGKPAPDIFLIAARRFPDNPKPESCLVFEDAPNGVQAAIAAGMQVVMVPDEHTPQELTKTATLVLKSLNDFDPKMFGLPPFCR